MDDQHTDTYDSYQQAKGSEGEVDQLHSSQPPSYHQEQNRHNQQPRQNAFSTPVRSSHAEAQAALEAVAAAANAGKIQMSPPTSTHPPPAAAAAAAAASTSEPSSPGVSNSPFSTHLGRNKACQSCRARKLKCDGQKPVCGQCAKGWQIKFRMAQNKAKSKKKGESPAHSESEGLPDYMPACEYLAITQRGSSRPARVGDESLDQDTPGPSAPSSTTTTPAKKRKRADENQDEQIARLQAEVARLRRQLAQVTGHSGNLANAFKNHRQQQQDGGDQADRLPSKDELAIAHMLATSMPSGEGSASSSFDYQQHAAAVAAAAAAASLSDDNVDVFDPALNETSDAPVAATTNDSPDEDIHNSQ